MGTSRLAHPPPWTSTCTSRPRRLPGRPRDRARRPWSASASARWSRSRPRPDTRIASRRLVAWEPPYRPLGDDASRARFAGWPGDTARGLRDRRAGGRRRDVHARRRRRRGVGPAARPRAAASSHREGDAALADSALIGLDPDGLARITAPTTIISGGASEPFYAPIAEPSPRASAAPAARLAASPTPRPITEPARSPRPSATRSAATLDPPRRHGAPPVKTTPAPTPTPDGSVRRRDRGRQRRADPRGPRDVRPDLRRLRPDEPRHLGVPGAVLAAPPRAGDRAPAGDARARRRVGHRQGRGRPPAARRSPAAGSSASTSRPA